RRKRALAAGEPIYGPMEYEEDTYFSYVFSNMVIELKRRLGRGELQATEEALRARYEETRGKLYRRGERVKVWAMKVSFRGGDAQGSLSKEEAKGRLAEMKGRLDDGEVFEGLARVYDDDGMLREWAFDDRSARFDWQRRPRAREEAMKLSEGDTSGIFEEGNAFYVLKCIERGEAGYLPFEEVEQNVRSKYVDERYEELVRGLVAGAEVEINRGVYEGIRVR
ncbi:MAG: peptidyl-prolyl cis-trans isomerase, partial [Armatimonadota bacterium]